MLRLIKPRKPEHPVALDSGANLKAFRRMDDAWVGSIDVAIKKAKTACLFAMPSGDLGKLSQPNGQLYSIEHSNEGLITFPGGLPIVDDQGSNSHYETYLESICVRQAKPVISCKVKVLAWNSKE